MSLERELTFELLNKGKSEQEILDTIEGMKELDVKMNSNIINTALKQYETKQKLKKSKDYRRSFKTELKELIRKEKERIEDTYPNLLSVKIIQKSFLDRFKCYNCDSFNLIEVYAQIDYVNQKQSIPFKDKEKESLFKYCTKCGNIENAEFDAGCGII